MQTITPDRTKNGRMGLRLWLVGLLAIIASVAANVLLRLLAVATLDISRFRTTEQLRHRYKPDCLRRARRGHRLRPPGAFC